MNIVQNPDYRESYANSVQIRASVWDFQLTFGLASPDTPDQITIHNHTEAQPQVSTGSNGDVTITLKKAIDGAVGDSMSSGSGMRVLSKQYGIKPFAGQ